MSHLLVEVQAHAGSQAGNLGVVGKLGTTQFSLEATRGVSESRRSSPRMKTVAHHWKHTGWWRNMISDSQLAERTRASVTWIPSSNKSHCNSSTQEAEGTGSL